MTVSTITFKTKEDAKGYAVAASPATSCSTCEHFQMRWCTMYDFDADPSWTCDAWERRKNPAGSWPENVPANEAYPLGSTLKEVPASFTTFKDTKGQWRWVLKSSNAFEDREREIVTTKALMKDVARTDRTGEYGPLRWWHVGRPEWRNPLDWRTVVAGKGLDIGDCDFSAMEGPILIESGTFRTPEIGAAIAAKADQFQASLGFSHPLEQPDRDGLFHDINRFERSLTPANKASNPRTGLVVTKERVMDPNKLAAFKEAVGEDIANGVIADAQETTKEARGAGIREKSLDDGLGPIEAQIAALQEQLLAFKAKTGITATNVPEDDEDGIEPVAPGTIIGEKAAPVATAAATHVEPDGDEDDMDEEADELYVGDMTGPELTALLHETLAPLFEQHTKALDLHGKLSAAHDSMKEMKSYLGGMAQKDSTIAELQEQMAAMSVTLKEATDVLATLNSELPRELHKPRPITHKASESTDNIIPPSNPMFQPEAGPQAVGPLDWIDSFVVHQQQQSSGVQGAVVVPAGLNGRVG